MYLARCLLQTTDINKQNIYISNFILELSSNYANNLKLTQEEVVTLKSQIEVSITDITMYISYIINRQTIKKLKR